MQLRFFIDLLEIFMLIYIVKGKILECLQAFALRRAPAGDMMLANLNEKSVGFIGIKVYAKKFLNHKSDDIQMRKIQIYCSASGNVNIFMDLQT